MSIARLHQFFTAPTAKKFSPTAVFWFTLSLTLATIYAFQALQKAFASEYVVQDDARQFVFWMQRFVDPELLRNDLMAEYYQSITPPGFASFYWLMAIIGIAPLLLSKILPAILALVTTIYVFGVSMEILPVPAAGFLTTLLLNHSIWMRNDVASATPKAFAYPLFAAFLYYLLRGSLLPCLVAIALEGLFFAPMAFISMGILLLRLLNWQKGRLSLSRDRKDFLFCLTGLGVGFLSLLPYAIASAKFAPLITIKEAKSVPEFMVGARVSFFYNHNPLAFWFAGPETGIFPYVGPAQLFIGILLPVVLLFSARFPLTSQISNKIKILTETVLASFAMFFAAHLLMFKLYGPSRYTQHSLRIVLAIASAILLITLLDIAFRAYLNDRPKTPPQSPRIRLNKKLLLFPILFSFLIFFALIIYPHTLRFFPRPGYVVGETTALYQYLQQQPKDSVIASISLEANNLPTFAKRPILVAREYSLPFHTKYYGQIRQRVIDLISAQYNPDLDRVRQFIQKYGVDFWLLESSAFQPDYFDRIDSANRRWLNLYQPATSEAISNLQQGIVPALAKFVDRCAVLRERDLVLLQTDCLLKANSN
ncbi:hypothetical protein ACE1CD_05795 [Aerosakkonema sp. BLCC-F183]|uniref:hypothetical protein n=1 Tax=Aerosakkonema sp. BLCC-F183 TaxID=3342834 RepID=UPI0035B70A64